MVNSILNSNEDDDSKDGGDANDSNANTTDNSSVLQARSTSTSLPLHKDAPLESNAKRELFAILHSLHVTDSYLIEVAEKVFASVHSRSNAKLTVIPITEFSVGLLVALVEGLALEEMEAVEEVFRWCIVHVFPLCLYSGSKALLWNYVALLMKFVNPRVYYEVKSKNLPNLNRSLAAEYGSRYLSAARLVDVVYAFWDQGLDSLQVLVLVVCLVVANVEWILNAEMVEFMDISVDAKTEGTRPAAKLEFDVAVELKQSSRVWRLLPEYFKKIYSLSFDSQRYDGDHDYECLYTHLISDYNVVFTCIEEVNKINQTSYHSTKDKDLSAQETNGSPTQKYRQNQDARNCKEGNTLLGAQTRMKELNQSREIYTVYLKFDRDPGRTQSHYLHQHSLNLTLLLGEGGRNKEQVLFVLHMLDLYLNKKGASRYIVHADPAAMLETLNMVAFLLKKGVSHLAVLSSQGRTDLEYIDASLTRKVHAFNLELLGTLESRECRDLNDTATKQGLIKSIVKAFTTQDVFGRQPCSNSESRDSTELSINSRVSFKDFHADLHLDYYSRICQTDSYYNEPLPEYSLLLDCILTFRLKPHKVTRSKTFLYSLFWLFKEMERDRDRYDLNTQVIVLYLLTQNPKTLSQLVAGLDKHNPNSQGSLGHKTYVPFVHSVLDWDCKHYDSGASQNRSIVLLTYIAKKLNLELYFDSGNCNRNGRGTPQGNPHSEINLDRNIHINIHSNPDTDTNVDVEDPLTESDLNQRMKLNKNSTTGDGGSNAKYSKSTLVDEFNHNLHDLHEHESDCTPTLNQNLSSKTLEYWFIDFLKSKLTKSKFECADDRYQYLLQLDKANVADNCKFILGSHKRYTCVAILSKWFVKAQFMRILDHYEFVPIESYIHDIACGYSKWVRLIYGLADPYWLPECAVSRYVQALFRGYAQGELRDELEQSVVVTSLFTLLLVYLMYFECDRMTLGRLNLANTRLVQTLNSLIKRNRYSQVVYEYLILSKVNAIYLESMQGKPIDRTVQEFTQIYSYSEDRGLMQYLYLTVLIEHKHRFRTRHPDSNPNPKANRSQAAEIEELFKQFKDLVKTNDLKHVFKKSLRKISCRILS